MKSEHYADAGVRLIRLQNIESGWFDDEDQAFVPEEHFAALPGHDAAPGDLLIAGLGDANHPLARACLLPPHVPVAMVKADCFRFRLDEARLRHRFVAHFLASAAARPVVDSEVRGATRARINLGGVSQVLVPQPPVREQDAIADFLDRKTASIDALIDREQRVLRLLEERRLATIAQVVSKGLNPTPAMKPSGHDWLGSIPAHWRVERIKYVARLESGHTPDRSERDYWLDSNDIPWVSLNDTKHLSDNDYIADTALHVNELGLANSSAHMLPPRVVVFTRDATIGKAAITTRPMAVSQHIIAWVCGPTLHPEYLLYVFYAMERELTRYTMGATLRTIGMPDVKQLVTPVPPLDEQKAIAEFLAEATANIVATRAKVERQVEQLREYRQALITAAVTGQLDITAQEAA